MAIKYEEARAKGLISSYSADEAVGITVNHLMFLKRMTRRQLGEALGVSGPNAGRKLRGDVAWSLDDLYNASVLLEVDVKALLPRRVKEETPAQPQLDGSSEVVAGAGFEPAASGL